ncbi:hypothetical protein VE02_04532 [Pseudogymnoascus sp. 03VT05]|nr:hypothetical protein VE02_04532 [Pseudogymnoascus sp. 03VT05]
MHLHATLSLLANCASAFTVPKGQPDGVYSVTYNPNGTETHTFLRPPVTVDATTTGSDVPGLLSLRSSVKARQVPNVQNVVGCGGYRLDTGTTNAANAGLDACTGGVLVGADKDFYSISGCTVAYFCNFSYHTYEDGSLIITNPTDTRCYKSDRQKSATIINGQCGGFYAGWNRITSSDGSYDGQYGWEELCGAGSNFCGRGVGG